MGEVIDDGLSAKPLRMPPPGDGKAADLNRALKNFCFAGEGKTAGAEDAPDLALQPAVLTPWIEPGLAWRDFPLYLPGMEEDGAGVMPLTALLDTSLDGSGAETPETKILRDQLWRLAGAAAREVKALGGAADFRVVVAKACESFLAEIDPGDAGDAGLEALQAQLEHLVDRLPKEGTLLGLGPHALLTLYGAVVSGRRESARRQFRDKVKALVAQLEDLLFLDRLHSPEGVSSERLREAMGAAAGSFVDSDALAGLLPPHRGTRPMNPQRRHRIEQTAEILTRYLASDGSQSDFVLVHSGELPEGFAMPAGAATRHRDSFAAAVSVFDEIMDEILPVFSAVRTAQLEVAGRYEPDIHDDFLARFDRQSLTADEWVIPRAVVVLETAEMLERNLLSSFSQLLRSERPIHVLVLHELMGCREGAARLEFGECDLGLGYRSIAHRKAFTLQSTLVQPGHLAAGLRAMLQAERPAVAFVGGAPWTEDDPRPWWRSVAEQQGRALPCFTYAPEAGDRWAARFDLSHNPQPEQLWPQYAIPYLDHDGSEKELAARFTFADSVALHPSCRKHFWVLPLTAWNDDQIELSEYLAAMGAERPKNIPFIWVRDAEGLLQRAAIGWTLLLACLERMDFWHMLQEFAGIDDEYAKRAEEKARAETGEAFEADRKARDAEHAVALAASRAASEKATVDRLVSVLMGLDAMPAAPLSPPPIPAAPAEQGPAAEAAPTVSARQEQEKEEEKKDAEEEDDFGDPYMDTSLCTTCDECIKINSSAFAYNDDKQAYLADALAATFAELVKAAELCPAHCIHPGSPRAGDATVTDKLRSKAAKLN